jgi:hypothetical protein
LIAVVVELELVSDVVVELELVSDVVVELGS